MDFWLIQTDFKTESMTALQSVCVTDKESNISFLFLQGALYLI